MAGDLSDRTYRKRRDALKNHTRAHDTPCWLCNEADWNWDDWKAPRAFTADHVEARSHGGRLLGELKPAHRSCNSRRSNRGTVVKEAPATTLRW